MKKQKKLRLHLIYDEIKAGKNPSKISKEHNINKKTLQYYLRQLKKNGQIEKVGYGIWKVSKEVSISSKACPKEVSILSDKIDKKKEIRGHAFNWKVKFKWNVNWEKRLKNNKINYKLIGINKSTPRIIFRQKKIWFTKTGLIIYEPISFFSASSYTSKGLAVYELDKTIKALGRLLKIDLSKYWFTTSREHYGMIKNELARQYNNKGEKLYIRDDKGLWLWIDFSHSIHEIETNKPKESRNVQNWLNDHKKHDFKVTPSFTLEAFGKVAKSLNTIQNQMGTLTNLISAQYTLKPSNIKPKLQETNNPQDITKIHPDYIC